MTSATSPFKTFLASIGNCAGIYVLGLCQQRNLPSEGIRIIKRINHSQLTGMVETIEREVQVPPELPEKYHPSFDLIGGTAHIQEAPGKTTRVRGQVPIDCSVCIILPGIEKMDPSAWDNLDIYAIQKLLGMHSDK